MDNLTKLRNMVWDTINKDGLSLLLKDFNSETYRTLEAFISDYWTLEMMDTNVTVHLYKKLKARMKFSKAILNQMLFTTLSRFNITTDENEPSMDFFKEFIFYGSGNIKSIDSYCSKVKDYAFNVKQMEFFQVADLVGQLKECFVQLSWVLSDKWTMDISIIDIFDICDADETLREWILEGPVKADEKLSLYEMEQRKAFCLKEFERIIHEKDIQPLRSLLDAGKGVRLPQLVDCLFMIATRPEMIDTKGENDTVIPYANIDSWLRGISSEDTYFYESYITRNSQIITKLEIRDPGAFQKMVSYLNNPNYLNHDENYMCDSKHYVEYHIENQNMLDKINDRYMILNDDVKNLYCVDSSKDTHLIGTTIKMRSPKTCNSQDGVCKYCTGEKTYKDNVYGPMGARVNLGSTYVKWKLAPKGQNYLAAKHNMTTKIVNVNFTHSDRIEVGVYDTDNLKISNGKIIISEKYEIESNVYVGFEVEYKGEIFSVSIEDGSGYLEVREDGLLHVVYKNILLPREYLRIKKLFEKPDEFESPMDTLNEILDTPYIVAEMMMRNMLFLVDDNGKVTKPDWSQKIDNSKLKFLSLKKSILENSGVVNKLCYGYFNDTLIDPNNYKDVSPMPYDVLFKDRSKLEKIREKYKEKYKKEIKEDIENEKRIKN